MNKNQRRNSKLGRILTCVFLFALVMGPGPGIYLVNPDPADPATCIFLGMPVIYVWAVFWFFVQAVVIVVAYFRLWDNAGVDKPHQNTTLKGNANGDSR